MNVLASRFSRGLLSRTPFACPAHADLLISSELQRLTDQQIKNDAASETSVFLCVNVRSFHVARAYANAAFLIGSGDDVND